MGANKMSNLVSSSRVWLVAAAVAGVLVMSLGSPRADDKAATGIASGLRLIMVDDVGCVYCRKWDAEVGVIYERSAVSTVAPLERRPKRHGDLAPYEPLAYTPTFILVRDGMEIGRIVGYPGADFFWAEFERLVAKAGPVQEPPRPPGASGPARDTSAPLPLPADRTGRIRVRMAVANCYQAP